MKIPKHLPEKLTIAFPIWLLFGTQKDHVYYDLDKIMGELKERGFNCIRFDDGAGLIHDIDGNTLEPFLIKTAFGNYDKYIRQQVIRDGLRDNLLKRLIDICTAAKAHGIYVILSSWFYLHTFWYLNNKSLADKLWDIPEYEVFMTFAKFLDYILRELKKHNLLDCIAYAEIANEADGWAYLLRKNESENITDEEIKNYRESHEKALDWIQIRYPEILFAYDCASPFAKHEFIPNNMQVYNAHPYFMWRLYTEMQNELGTSLFVDNPVSLEEIKKTRNGYRPAKPDWYDRVWYYCNLDKNKMPFAENWLEERFKRNYHQYIDKLEKSIDVFNEVRNQHGGSLPIVCGEGVSYIGSYLLQWEEKSDSYWKMLEYMAKRYREIDMWGSVVRTCCGPEDPSWYQCKDKILRVNNIFLGNI